MVMMISFIVSTIFALIIIPILRKMNVGQRISVYLEETHRKKSGTPTMGGLIFILPSIIIFITLWFFDKIHITYSLIIVLITFISYGVLGFIDNY